MSILLEALRQKKLAQSPSVKTAAAKEDPLLSAVKASTAESGSQITASNEKQGESHSLDEAVAALKIETPTHLDWQLQLSPKAESVVVDDNDNPLSVVARSPSMSPESSDRSSAADADPVLVLSLTEESELVAGHTGEEQHLDLLFPDANESHDLLAEMPEELAVDAAVEKGASSVTEFVMSQSEATSLSALAEQREDDDAEALRAALLTTSEPSDELQALALSDRVLEEAHTAAMDEVDHSASTLHDIDKADELREKDLVAMQMLQPLSGFDTVAFPPESPPLSISPEIPSLDETEASVLSREAGLMTGHDQERTLPEEIERPQLATQDRPYQAQAAKDFLQLNQQKATTKSTRAASISLQRPELSKNFWIGSASVLALCAVGWGAWVFYETEQDALSQLSHNLQSVTLSDTQQNVTQETTTTDATSTSVASPVMAESNLDSPKVISSGDLPAPIISDASHQEQHTSPVSVEGSKPVKQKTPARYDDKSVDQIVEKPKKVMSAQKIDITQMTPVSVERVGKSVSISSLLQEAWQAWQVGQVDLSEAKYRQVLEKQPRNRDALIGMYVLFQLKPETQANAQQLKQQLQALYPNDLEIKEVLQRGTNTPSVSATLESDLKQQQLLEPQSSSSFYRLGIFYASKQRWSEAQAQFFKAASIDPGQPEYLANLAICYDQLGKRALAIQAYQRAIQSSEFRPNLVDLPALQQRLAYLTEISED